MAGKHEAAKAPRRAAPRSETPRRRPARPADKARAARAKPLSLEQLFFERVFPYARRSHRANQARLRRGVMWLFVLPLLLAVVRGMTGSSKIAFLIIWIIGMFGISAFLVFVAYLDHELQESLGEMEELIPAARGAELGALLNVDAEAEGTLLSQAVHHALEERRDGEGGHA